MALVGVDVDWLTDPGGGIVTGATRGFVCEFCEAPGNCWAGWFAGCEGVDWGWEKAVGVPGKGPGVSPCP